MNGFDNEMSYNPRVIQVHANELAALALSSTGNLVATASKQGTLIRIFLTTGLCEKLFEFRRGSDAAEIYSLAFSCDSGFLCVSSDKGTIHLYGIRDTKSNRMSALSHAMNDAFGDLSNFKVDNEYACLCTFSDANHIVAASVNGVFHRYIFTTDGRCNREEYDIYLDGIDRCEF